MIDEDIFKLMQLNIDRYNHEKQALYDEYIKMDNFIIDELEKNRKHFHFRTKKEMVKVMSTDFHPFHTFSWGKK